MIKDALASAVEIAIPPKRSGADKINDFLGKGNRMFNSRFGGMSYK